MKVQRFSGEVFEPVACFFLWSKAFVFQNDHNFPYLLATLAS